MDKEKVLIVVVDYKRIKGWRLEDLGNELEELVAGCGGEVVDKVFYRIDKPSAAHLIGEGKMVEISNICSQIDVDTVVFSHDLKGSHQRNLEEVIKVKTIDRTQLILDIFARHATSQEGKMQVELAQLEYLLPRLVGKGIELSRLGGGIGTLGPGETKLEVDRRRIAQRIGRLKKDLKEVAAGRMRKRKKRRDMGVPAISLVGYTNAGKSTLLNRLTDSEQVTKDGLFTTLDPLARQFVLPNHQKVVIMDTVGFMHDLPHHLIESFHATLEHVTEADLLLHVVDVSHPNFRNRFDSVLSVLKELDAHEKNVITVLNKIDALDDHSWLEEMGTEIKGSIALSAATGENVPLLVEQVTEKLSALLVNIDLRIPIKRMDLINLAHEEGQVYSVKYYNDSVHIRAALPVRIAGKYYKEQVGEKGSEKELE